jgi:hypothetical protein
MLLLLLLLLPMLRLVMLPPLPLPRVAASGGEISKSPSTVAGRHSADDAPPRVVLCVFVGRCFVDLPGNPKPAAPD